MCVWCGVGGGRWLTRINQTPLLSIPGLVILEGGGHITWYTMQANYLAGSSGILLMTSFPLSSSDVLISPRAIDTHSKSAHTRSIFMVDTSLASMS